METPKQTLLEYLRAPNPEVRGEYCPKGTNSKSKSKAWQMPREINEWVDFEFDTLTAIYNGNLYRVLQEEFKFQDFSKVPEFPFCQFFDENSLESLLIKWTQSVVTEALEKSQSTLKNPGPRIFMVRGGQANFSSENIKWRPDWACVQLPTPNLTERQRNLLPGDTKVSTKWWSGLIELGETRTNKMTLDSMRPLNQIYSYCLNSMSRYGYILTDKEVVVVRVRLNQDSDSQRTFEGFDAMDADDYESLSKRADEVGVIDVKAIPWQPRAKDSHSSHNDLTINLALWWLHLLASSDNEIADEKTYGALRDSDSSIWGSPRSNQQTNSLPYRNGKKRAKSKGNHRRRTYESTRVSKDGITKRGRSQGPRSAKNSFEQRR